MFYGREEELNILKNNYLSNEFRMVVVYGRRRVGKSFLLQHFFSSLNTKIIAFQAIENSASLSIEAFKDAILDVYPSSFAVELNTWKECFAYLNEHITDEKLVLCIDEINYIFRADSTFASQLQNEIDNNLKNKNVMLVVCGSNITSIENEVLNANSPLYGRRNASIKLEEFNYLEASQFYSSYSAADKVMAYSIFGGKGKNLAVINPRISVKENVINEILTPGGALADEIDLLLKDDFRDTNFYKELLYVMSLGNTTFNDISTKINESSAKVATYIDKLIATHIIEKNEVLTNKSKKEYRYFIKDNFFSFYFRFVYKRKNILNILLTPEAYYERFIENDINSYVGIKFESICEQYLINSFKQGKFDFVPDKFGKYFGKHKDNSTFDIDVLFKDDNHAICGECKFTNKEFDLSDMNELVDNAQELGIKDISYYLFVKSGIKNDVINNYPQINVVDLESLF